MGGGGGEALHSSVGCGAQVNPVHENIGEATVAAEEADAMKKNQSAVYNLLLLNFLRES